MPVMESDRPRIFGDGTPEADWQRWPGWADIPIADVASLGNQFRRVIVVSPHPDDELLGCGGMLAILHSVGCPVVVVAVTDGEASHPGSSYWTRGRLAVARPRETEEAMNILGLCDARIVRLHLPDGGLYAHERQLLCTLQGMLQATDMVVSTWAMDGHPDHESTSRAASSAARAVGASYFEVPVWAWHWSFPGDARMPWARARRIPLDAIVAGRKSKALEAFRSQVLADPDPRTARGPVLPHHVLKRFMRPYEVVFL